MIKRTEISPYDSSDYLDSEEAIGEYLRAAQEAGDPAALDLALRNIEKARSRLAREAQE